MQYQLPRLTRMWTHLERQAGGMVKGMGEKQIEVMSFPEEFCVFNRDPMLPEG